jgi:prephenate dehydrogenase
MKLTPEQRQLIVHCLRVAAERFRHDAETARESDLTYAAAKSFSDTFEKQSTDAEQLADTLEANE